MMIAARPVGSLPGAEETGSGAGRGGLEVEAVLVQVRHALQLLGRDVRPGV